MWVVEDAACMSLQVYVQMRRFAIVCLRCVGRLARETLAPWTGEGTSCGVWRYAGMHGRSPSALRPPSRPRPSALAVESSCGGTRVAARALGRGESSPFDGDEKVKARGPSFQGAMGSFRPRVSIKRPMRAVVDGRCCC